MWYPWRGKQGCRGGISGVIGGYNQNAVVRFSFKLDVRFETLSNVHPMDSIGKRGLALADVCVDCHRLVGLEILLNMCGCSCMSGQGEGV
jgi:hypothetical protein